MDEKEEFNLTLPIILIGILAIAVLLFFTLFDKNPTQSNNEALRNVIAPQSATAYHFIAPDRVPEGDMALFSWKTDVSDDATCEGSSVPEGSDGGWSGEKSTQGQQEVGPIEKNTTYYLDCADGEEVVRDIELVSIGKPSVSIDANREVLKVGEKTNITWDAVYVRGCELSDGSLVVATGENGVYTTQGIAKSMTYTLTCQTHKEPIRKSITINTQ